jgi:hypothetical protein
VFNNTINSPLCPYCKKRVIIGNATLLYHNAPQNFAVWYEPQYDRAIDEESKGYSQMFGSDSYLAIAPRICEWEAFKRAIMMFEKGELKGNPGKPSPELKKQFDGFVKSISSQQKKSRNSGCLVVFIIIVALSIFIVL